MQVDGDGVRTLKSSGIRASVWLLALAMLLVGVSVFVIFRPAVEGYLSAGPQPPPSSVAAAPRAAAAPMDTRLRPAPASRVVPPPVPAAQAAAVAPPAGQGDEPRVPAPKGAVAAAAAAPEEAQAEEEQGGIGVFPPPGTKPIKQGIVVPEGFELPPGYVRHYQATDDGKMLPAILMFHPDYQPMDARGNPIPVPENRVVPPELAPPGMPVQMLDVPEVHVPAIDPADGGSAQDAAP